MRPAWSGPRLRHPVKGDTALDPERLPPCLMSPRANAHGSTPHALFVKTRRSASRTLSLDFPRCPASTLQSVRAGLDPASSHLAVFGFAGPEIRRGRRCAIHILKERVPVLREVIDSIRGRNPFSCRRALRFTTLGSLRLATASLPGRLSSLGNSALPSSSPCCSAWRSHLSALLSPPDRPDARGSSPRLPDLVSFGQAFSTRALVIDTGFSDLEHLRRQAPFTGLH